MIITLLDGRRGRNIPTVSIRGDLAKVTTMPAYDDPGGTYGARLSESARHRLVAARNAAWEELAAVDDPQTLVTHRENSFGQQGAPMTLELENRGEKRTISWTYPDTVPAPVEKLYRMLETLTYTIPQREWEKQVVGRCQQLTARYFGGKPESWTLSRRTKEMFDARMSLPYDMFQGAMAAVGLMGERIVLTNGKRFVAFHTRQNTIECAESWRNGTYPKYPEALLDLAHEARAVGDLPRAKTILERLSSSRGFEGDQARLEVAEVLGEMRRFAAAERAFGRFVGSGSLEEHTIAMAGLAWVAQCKKLPRDAELPPPPSRWAELDIHPWWRRSAERRVRGVPRHFPSVAAALDGAQTTWRRAMDRTIGERHIA